MSDQKNADLPHGTDRSTHGVRLAAGPSRAFSNAELGELAALASDWLWETDSELRFSWLSDEFAQVTGMDASEVLGRRRFDFLVQVARGSKSAAAHLDALQAHRPFRDFVYRMKGSREECRWVSVSGTPRFDEDGNFLGYRGVGHNVTGLAASFEELQRLHGQLAGTAERDRMLMDQVNPQHISG